MANIAIIAPRYHTNMVCFVKSLKELNYKVDLFVQYEGKSEDHTLIKPKKLKSSQFYVFLSSILSLFNKKTIKSQSELRSYIPSYSDLKNKLRKRDCTFVKGLASPSTLLYLYLARKSSKKVIFIWQTDRKNMKLFLMKLFSWIILNIFKANLIVTPNDPNFKKLGNKFGYLPFCVETKNFKKTKSRYLKIISVGKFVERKDQKLLLKAFSIISKEVKNIKLTLVGEIADKKYYTEIKQIIQNNKLNVKLITNLKHKELLKIYKNYDLFILPSYSEPAAYSPFEAMAAKLPIICSDECGTKSCIRGNGYIFKAKNLKSLINKMNKILSSEIVMKKMGKESFKLIQKEYSMKKQKEILSKLM